jgi:regulator of sigma E protease
LDILNTVLTIVKVALGLGFVVFIHELGHFLLAKWNGVKVEKFSIGFGPTLFGFRRGETEYVLAALPLGGFVKMLGEGPDEQEASSSDPRAYPNKSVSARMAIISAGVIMNILLAYVFFTYTYMNERTELPAVLGAVSAGSVAYEAGLRAGDEIVAIDDSREVSFTELQRKIALSSKGQVLHFQVKRPGHEGLINLELMPRRDATADAPRIGISNSSSLDIIDFKAPAGMANPPTYQALTPKERRSKVDVLVEAGPAGESPTRLSHIVDYDRLIARYADRPITHVIERLPILASGARGTALERFALTTPPNHFIDFGLRMEIEPISGIAKDSPADKAGFRKGDRIVKVDGNADCDPMRLPGECFAKAGKPMTFEVEREAAPGRRQTQVLTATPEDVPPRTKPSIRSGEPVDLAGLGLCYPIRTHVVAVRPDSPAARAGIKAGDTINALTLPKIEPAKPTMWGRLMASIRGLFNWDKPEPIEFKDDAHSWFEVLVDLQYVPVREVELAVNNASQPRKVTPEIDPDAYNPTRGLQFQGMIQKLPPQDLATAMRSGYDETIQNIGMVYSIFRSLAERRVSPKNLGGPIMIAQVAYSMADSGFAELISFLAMLSINLAVLNFLPIPPLDGGQMVFLIAEKVRGRPLPESALIAGTYLGLILVLSLMIFVTYQDVFRSFIG